MTMAKFQRYERQMALPGIAAAHQDALSRSKILAVGAGGLGAASLPYLAAAGIGEIHIADHDTISVTNLHRQTIYQDAQEDENKAECAARYLMALNPDIKAQAITDKITRDSDLAPYDLILDGSDNFETKTLLNDISIATQTPLISASVNQFSAQCGIFAGYAHDRPCYSCMFSELPDDARNCNDAGILGTAAGMAGITQAHITLQYLMGLHDAQPGLFLTMDYAAMRMQKLKLNKDSACKSCAEQNHSWEQPMFFQQKPEMISMAELQEKDHIIVDVRNDDEVAADPISGNVLHIPLPQLAGRIDELEAQDTLLAFVCAGNIRSVKAQEYCAARGMDNLIVLDKFSI